MKLGMLTPSMSRQAGGLFGAISSLTRSVHAEDCDLHVFAGEDAYSGKDQAAWDGVALSVLPQRGPSAFGYQVGLRDALAHTAPDILHVHGLWMYPSVAALRWKGRERRPYIISPHGMLDPWAVRNSGWKKKLAGLLYENNHLKVASCIHALCRSEYESIRSYGLDNPVAIIPNGVDLPDLSKPLPEPGWAQNLSDGSKVLLFLGRLHPKKGLENLLRAWGEIKKEKLPDAEPWHLVVAGWEQGGHQAELEKLATDFGIEKTVHFVGPLFGSVKAAGFKRADAFVLPSFSEGLPMAVLEAWAYGLPVIMTPQCNIQIGFKEAAAVKVEPEVGSIISGLHDFFSLTEDQRTKMGRRGRELVENQFIWGKVAKEMMSVYRWVLDGGSTPSCVIMD